MNKTKKILVGVCLMFICATSAVTQKSNESRLDISDSLDKWHVDIALAALTIREALDSLKQKR